MDILKELNLDFSNFKLPLEPKQLILLYLAYKVINNLDRIDFNSILSGGGSTFPRQSIPDLSHIPKHISKNTINTGSPLVLVCIVLFVCFMIFNTIMDKISISFDSYAVDLEKLKNINKNFNNNCNIKKCPLFNDYNIDNCPMFKNENLKKCPIFKDKNINKCPIFNKSENNKSENNKSENNSEDKC